MNMNISKSNVLSGNSSNPNLYSTLDRMTTSYMSNASIPTSDRRPSIYNSSVLLFSI